jgi:hypothetical protein
VEIKATGKRSKTRVRTDDLEDFIERRTTTAPRLPSQGEVTAAKPVTATAPRRRPRDVVAHDDGALIRNPA